MNYYRQGDVCIIPIAGMPKVKAVLTEVPRTPRGVVLQEGEVTGHAHRITEENTVLFEPGEASVLAERFLRVGAGGAVLTHEEHAPIELPEGWYEVRRQREYEPEAIRLVAD